VTTEQQSETDNLDAVLDTHSEIVNNLYRMTHNPDVVSIDRFKDELKQEHKTASKLENFISRQSGGTNKAKYDKFVASQKETVSGEAADGGEITPPSSESKQFSEDDATRIAGELSDELTSMPELFTYKDGVNRKTAMANNRTMSQRARRLYRMIDLDSHPEIHEKLSPQAKQKLRNETNGIAIHLPKKIRDGLVEETKQYDKDSYYDHKDDTKQHNQDIEAKRQASAATEQSHKKTIQDMQKQGGKHELFNSDSHKQNMELQEWTGGKAGTRDMEAEFDQFMEKKYGADYTKEDAAKERREQGLPPGGPRPRLVKDKDGVEKFLGYYLWHAASRHWVTPEYAKLHPDLAGGARAGDVVTWDKNLKDSDGAIAYDPHDDAAREAGIAGVMTNNGMQLASRVGEKDQFDNTTFEDISGLWDHMTPEQQKAAIQTASYVQDNLQRIRGGEGGITTGDLGQRISVYRGKGGALSNYSAKLSAAGGFKGALARFIGTITPESLGGGPVREQYRGRGSREE